MHWTSVLRITGIALVCCAKTILRLAAFVILVIAGALRASLGRS